MDISNVIGYFINTLHTWTTHVLHDACHTWCNMSNMTQYMSYMMQPMSYIWCRTGHTWHNKYMMQHRLYMTQHIHDATQVVHDTTHTWCSTGRTWYYTWCNTCIAWYNTFHTLPISNIHVWYLTWAPHNPSLNKKLLFESWPLPTQQACMNSIVVRHLIPKTHPVHCIRNTTLSDMVLPIGAHQNPLTWAQKHGTSCLMDRALSSLLPGNRNSIAWLAGGGAKMEVRVLPGPFLCLLYTLATCVLSCIGSACYVLILICHVPHVMVCLPCFDSHILICHVEMVCCSWVLYCNMSCGTCDGLPAMFRLSGAMFHMSCMTCQIVQFRQGGQDR